MRPSAAGRAFEEERRRVEWDAERSRLLLVRHGRLDRLAAADDDDAETILEQLVERMALEILGGQAGTSDSATCSVSIAIVSRSA